VKRKTLFAIVEWLVVILLVWLVFRENIYPAGSSTPEEAHRLSESSYHYGPSVIVRKVVVPFDQHQVVFLGTYKDWFSADSVLQKRGGWVPGGGVGGVKIERDKSLSYSWEGTGHKNLIMYKFFGYVSDDRIAAVELLLTDKDTGKPMPLREKIAEDRLFLFLWEGKDGEMQAVRGLDSQGNVVYEQKLA
jgi:hypothetical protein